MPATPTPAPVGSGEVEIPDYILNPNMEMPVIRSRGQDYIGVLSIPSLGLELPVISQLTNARLKVAPCRYSGSAYKDNMVISAHNYASHFGSLRKVQEGARVTFTDVDGNVFVYKVVLKETLMPEDTAEMTSGEYDLTLFTCTGTGGQRVTVRCDRVLVP